MSIKFSTKDDRLFVQSNNTAFVGAAPLNKNTGKGKHFHEDSVYKIDCTYELMDNEPKDWTKTHYTHEGYWVPKLCYMHRDFMDYRWRYESFEVFKQEVDFQHPFRKRRMIPEEREIRKKMQAHREAYANEADKKYSLKELPYGGYLY
jgi:hypothetical protein